jgi:hypothetical protein
MNTYPLGITVLIPFFLKKKKEIIIMSISNIIKGVMVLAPVTFSIIIPLTMF